MKENEKFNIAQEILKKYGSRDDLRLLEESPKKSPIKEERYKDQATSTSPEVENPRTSPDNKVMPVMTPLRNPQIWSKGKVARTGGGPVRPFVNPNRTALDKVVDYVIGDGPNNR